MTTARHADRNGVDPNSGRQRPHLVDADVAGEASGGAFEPFEDAEIGMAARVDQADDRVIGGSFKPGKSNRWPGGLCQDPAHRGMGERRLADPTRPSKQPGVVHIARMPGGGELLDGAGRGRRSWQEVGDGIEQTRGDVFG